MGKQVTYELTMDVFYRFLKHEYIQEDCFGAIESLERMSPHELYRLRKGQLSKTIRGVGAKKEYLIMQAIEEYKPEFAFCKCGEPELPWYRFCPYCGKSFNYQEV